MNSNERDEKRLQNQERRIERIKRWADHVRSVPDEEWSKEQNRLVNAMFER